jgi:hypothetical protein
LRWGLGIQDDDSDEGGWKRRFDVPFIENMNNEKRLLGTVRQIRVLAFILPLYNDNV